MNRMDACPDVSAYREMMRGQALTDCDGLLGHLETCPACRGKVLALEDWLSNATDQVPDSPARRRAREIATRAEGNATGSAAGDVSVLAGVMTPSQTAGELGLLGGYRLLRVLGSGGMGVVFEAVDDGLGRRVALKVMRPEIAANPQHHERFLREAKAMASVQSDHVCPIFQVGQDGVPFMAMPLLAGEPLDARLRREKPLTVADVLRIGREIALGLAAAHQKGLIHRDVKPANVWLEATESGPVRARLLDFGLVRGGGDAQLTQTGEVMGTPAYLSLEQARGQRVDARSDLFSLGVLLYEATTGARPFGGTDAVSMVSSLALDTPQPPASRRPGVPPALSDLIMRLLEKAPENRPATAAEVARHLGELASATAAPVAPRAAVGRPEKEWGRLAWLAVLILALGLGGGLTAYVFLSPPSNARPFVEGDQNVNAEAEEAAYQAAMLAGAAASDAGWWAEAIESYDEALKRKADDPAALAGRKVAQDELNRQALAKEDHQAALLLVRQEEARQQTEAEALFREGMDAWIGLDEVRARERFGRAAHKGHEVAAGWAGGLIFRGKGGKKDEEAGKKQVEQALPAIRQLADAGNADAQGLLGALYAEGLGVARDDKQAAEWYGKAAEKGDAVAMNNLGEAHASGRGVTKDEKQAAQWYAKAAEKGDPVAMYHLAAAYVFGRGMNKNEKAAFELLQKAADKGHANAMLDLGAMYLEGRGVDEDEKKAVEWFVKAAGQGNSEAMNVIGLAYAKGVGVGKDEKKAAEWYAKAAEKGHPFAQKELGRRYKSGLGVDKDEKKAAEWYAKAAEKGVPEAAFQLGVSYENGDGVRKDAREALSWYKKAAALGHKGATQKVKEIESRKE